MSMYMHQKLTASKDVEFCGELHFRKTFSR